MTPFFTAVQKAIGDHETRYGRRPGLVRVGSDVWRALWDEFATMKSHPHPPEVPGGKVVVEIDGVTVLWHGLLSERAIETGDMTRNGFMPEEGP